MATSARRCPEAVSETVSRTMSRIRGRDTGPEMAVRRGLWARGVRGYRVNVKGLPGRPDVVFRKRRVAVFIHGCFWHRCPHCKRRSPKAHADYWGPKLDRNVERDREALVKLEADGWTAVVVWECEVKRSLDDVLDRIMGAVARPPEG